MNSEGIRRVTAGYRDEGFAFGAVMCGRASVFSIENLGPLDR